MEYKTKVSCFGYANLDGREFCKALTRLYCKREDCRFYKPDHEINSRQMAIDIRNYNKTHKK